MLLKQKFRKKMPFQQTLKKKYKDIVSSNVEEEAIGNVMNV